MCGDAVRSVVRDDARLIFEQLCSPARKGRTAMSVRCPMLVTSSERKAGRSAPAQRRRSRHSLRLADPSSSVRATLDLHDQAGRMDIVGRQPGVVDPALLDRTPICADDTPISSPRPRSSPPTSGCSVCRRAHCLTSAPFQVARRRSRVRRLRCCSPLRILQLASSALALRKRFSRCRPLLSPRAA